MSSKHLVQVKSTAQVTPRFLTKVNTYISGSKHGRFILNNKLLLKTNPRDHEQISLTRFFSSKNLQFLSKVTKFLHMHIAKCNIVINTYLSKNKKQHDIQYTCMCKTISNAVNACSCKCKLCFVLKGTQGTKSI